VPLESISDEREITKSIRQKSHVRLSAAEAANALKALGVGSESATASTKVERHGRSPHPSSKVRSETG
jgi:flagellar motor protein MotB